MPHLVKNANIILDNGIELDNMFCYWIPDFNKTTRNKLLFDVKFYKDLGSFMNNFGRIYPLKPETINTKNRVIIPPLTIGIIESNLDMNRQKFSKHVSDYLENIFGYWSVVDLDYNNIVELPYISEDNVSLFTLQPEYAIERIYLKEVSGNLDCGCTLKLKTKEANSEDEIVISEIDVTPNMLMEDGIEITVNSFDENKLIQIVCENDEDNFDWNTTIVDLMFKLIKK